MIEARFFEATVSASSRLPEDTPVYLVAKHYTESGVVRSCHEYGAKFIVTIRFNAGEQKPRAISDRDPGVLAVDDFLTEEQELEILREIEEELHRHKF
jgi:hypothetical protein